MSREIHTPSFTLFETDVKYFAELSRECLKVLKLLHHEKMSYAEIARDTGWPQGTVARRIFRAREIIRQLRAADEPPETMQEPTWGMVRA
jgi:IS30 family transposase